MLMVIFGAGASYDSVPAYPPPQSGRLPIATPHAGDVANNYHRPPLANQLFENRPLFANTIQLYSACEPIIPRLRNHHGETVEAALQDLQEKADGYSRGPAQLAAVRYYLVHAISNTQRLWSNVACGVTNYKTFLDQIERTRRGHEKVCLVTFNYDTLLEEALADFDFRIGDLDHYIDGHSFYRVFKPHGSINWVRLVDAPIINPEETNSLILDRELIGKARELKLSTAFRMADPQTRNRIDGKPLFPAIAIPVDKKSLFECPQEHIDQLATILPEVTRLLLIGWRATEAHFLELLRKRLTPGIRLYTVAASEMEAVNINKALETALPGIFAGSTPDVGPNAYESGFTYFLLSRRAESFLAY